MQDEVILKIGDKEIKYFISYDIESDLYIADNAFSLELSDPETEIDPGQLCKIYVNGVLELNGIIDSVTDKESKSGTSLSVEGRDLMGLLVDSHIEEFVPLEGVTIKTLAETLLKDVPFINLKPIV